MFKKKLLRRALPVLLSVAMVCQSAPVMSMIGRKDEDDEEKPKCIKERKNYQKKKALVLTNVFL